MIAAIDFLYFDTAPRTDLGVSLEGKRRSSFFLLSSLPLFSKFGFGLFFLAPYALLASDAALILVPRDLAFETELELASLAVEDGDVLAADMDLTGFAGRR